jgi:DNA-binding NarL/FixJ family response regulator
MIPILHQQPKRARARQLASPLANLVNTTTEVGPPTIDASSGFGTGLASQPNLLIVIERRDFVRGCLTCWLDSSCGEFEILAVAAAEASLDDDALAQAVAVVIGIDSPEQTDGWLGRQIGWLRAKCPSLPIIMIVEVDETNTAEALVGRFAVQGYIPTSSSMKVAAAALRLVVAGGRYFPTNPDHGSSPALTSTDPTVGGTRFAKLTPREEEVLSVLGRGAQNKIIAYRLGMSLSTVKAHVHSIIRKLNVRNRTEAVVAIRAVQARAPSMNGGMSLAAEDGVHVATNGRGTEIAYRSAWREESGPSPVAHSIAASSVDR